VEKLGEPPKKQVVAGAKTSNIHKAARCCIDWAIKHFDAVADGKLSAKKSK